MNDRLRDITAGRSEPRKKGLSAWFAGRARRREYWAWVGPGLALIVVAGAINMPALVLLIGVVLLAIWIRRLHDLGHSGWWAPVINIGVNITSGLMGFLLGEIGALLSVLVALAPFVALGVLPGQRGHNEFGPPPGQKDVVDAFS